MENASKALIIAGAILLAILIISLGIMIYNQASGVVNNNAMSEVDISSFNQKFEQYTGTNVRGAQVNSLLSQIQTNNVTYQDDTSRQVQVSVDGSASWNGTRPSGTLVGVSYDKGCKIWRQFSGGRPSVQEGGEDHTQGRGQKICSPLRAGEAKP